MSQSVDRRTALGAIGAFVGHTACGGSASPLSPSPPEAPAATRDGRFLQDINRLAQELPRLHMNLFFRTPRETFEREVEALRARVSSSTDAELVAGLCRLAALPRDAHTGVSVFQYPAFRRLPIRLRSFSDGLHVTSVGPAAAPALGARVLSVGEFPAADLLPAIAPFVSHENESWLHTNGINYLVIPELLAAARVAPSADRLAVLFRRADGVEFTLTLDAAPSGQDGPFVEAPLTAPPLYRQRTGENYWTTWTTDDVLYVAYNRCQNAAENMTSFARRVFDEVDRRPPRAFVIDLRNNAGGDSSVADPLIAGLRSRRFLADTGRLFSFIGGTTFSSALMNAITLKRELNATLVGAPTGGKPNAYGEVRSFSLNNVGLPVSYSVKYFRLWPEGDPESLFPDVAAPVSSSDHFSGRDPALEAVRTRVGG